jgi:hypothetical protein
MGERYEEDINTEATNLPEGRVEFFLQAWGFASDSCWLRTLGGVVIRWEGFSMSILWRLMAAVRFLVNKRPFFDIRNIIIS